MIFRIDNWFLVKDEKKMEILSKLGPKECKICTNNTFFEAEIKKKTDKAYQVGGEDWEMWVPRSVVGIERDVESVLVCNDREPCETVCECPVCHQEGEIQYCYCLHIDTAPIQEYREKLQAYQKKTYDNIFDRSDFAALSGSAWLCRKCFNTI